MIGTIRPEYLEAVEAARLTARLNPWLIPLLLAAPLSVLVPVLRRWHWAAITGLALIAAVATWFSYYGWSETSWRTIEALAVTDAELAEAASDTDAVFEPIFLGTPIAVFYSAIWCGIAYALRAFTKRFRRPGIPIEPPKPNKRIERADPAPSSNDSPQLPPRSRIERALPVSRASCLTLAVLFLSVAGYVAWVRPGQSGILVQGQSPDGQEFRVVQTFKDLIEPYQVSFYIRDTNRVWRWNYLEHEDHAWRSASVEFVNGKALVSRNGKLFREVGMPTGAVDLASMPGGYVHHYCPPEFSVQDVLKFHNETYK